MIISKTPEKEMAIPTMLNTLILSRKVIQATRGAKTGMVAMITAAMVGELYFNP